MAYSGTSRAADIAQALDTNTCQVRRQPPMFLCCRWVSYLQGPCFFHPYGQNDQEKHWSHVSSSRMSGRPGHMYSAATARIFKPFGHYGAKSENWSKPNGFARRFLPRTTLLILLSATYHLLLLRQPLFLV